MKRRWPIYQATEKRVLFNLEIIEDQVKSVVEDILTTLGFSVLPLKSDLALQHYAKALLGGTRAVYQAKAQSHEAPAVVNCSTFTQWVYAQTGVRIPKLAIQQYQAGEPVMDLCALRVGDLLFKAGTYNYWDYNDPGCKIGHVGVVADVNSKTGSVVHATASGNGVVETTLDDFIKKTGHFVGACRIVANLKDWQVLETPAEHQLRITSSDDLKWLILEHLPGA